MARPNFIHLRFHGFRDLNDMSSVNFFKRLFNDFGTGLIPTRFGLYEPMREKWGEESLERIWLHSEREGYGGIIFAGKSSTTYSGSIKWESDKSNKISMYIDMNMLREYTRSCDWVRFLDLAKKAFLWINGVYGFICHSTQLHYTPSLSYRDCLARISWVTLLSLPYVEMFGRDAIMSSPCEVEEFADNTFMLLTSKGPQPSTPELESLQDKVEKHLGENAFYREDEQARVSLTLDDLKAGKGRPDKSRYRSPDFSRYLGQNDKANDQGMVYIINEDGTTETHIIKSRE